MKKIISIAAVFIAAFAMCISAAASTVTVTGRLANCRSMPGKNNAYLGRVYKGEKFELLGTGKAPNGKTWYKINHDGKTCYICSSFCRLSETKKQTAPTGKREYLGRYFVTGYCKKCNSPKNSTVTASGKKATAGRTVAMRGLPFGTKIYIDGIGERIVEDRCGKSGVCDVFCASHNAEYGITGYKNVWVIK